MLRAADKKGCVLAAVCGGVFALAQAGLLRGRKFTHPFLPEQMEFLEKYFTGSLPEEKEFLHDGNLLTAKPYAHIDFAVELAARLQAIPPTDVIFYKNYHRGFPLGRIRPLALALLRRENGQMLLHEGVDQVTGRRFYRPLGGGIEFGESGRETVRRELEEEIHQAVDVGEELGVVENRFTYEGRQGHEIIALYAARFTNPAAYKQEKFMIDESGTQAGFAVWRSLAEIQAEQAPLYPEALLPFLHH
jgi:ADP-ribose pyrophosphatase YjhB (NUDIX family)